MKKMIIFLIVIMVAAFNYQASYAVGGVTGTTAGEFVKVGAAGSQFLKIGVGARGTAMGGAFTSLANDLTSVYWNPAGLADVNYMSGHFSYTSWFANFSHNFAALAMPISDQFTIAANLVSFGTDKIEYTTLEHPEGTGTYYSVQDLSIGATFAGYLTEQFSFGITAKYVTNSFADLSSSGFAFDIGTLYETGIQGIKLGFAIMNLGTEMNYTGPDLNSTKRLTPSLNAMPLDVRYLTSGYNMPLVFRAGASSTVYEKDQHRVIASADFITYSDVSEQFAIGAEYTWNDILSVRGGYRFGHDELGFAGGIGINYIGGGLGGQIDYSIAPTADLGLVNRLSISLDVR